MEKLQKADDEGRESSAFNARQAPHASSSQTLQGERRKRASWEMEMKKKEVKTRQEGDPGCLLHTQELFSSLLRKADGHSFRINTFPSAHTRRRLSPSRPIASGKLRKRKPECTYTRDPGSHDYTSSFLRGEVRKSSQFCFNSPSLRSAMEGRLWKMK